MRWLGSKVLSHELRSEEGDSRGLGETDLEIAVSIKEEIGRLEIAMEDVCGVESLERTESLESGAGAGGEGGRSGGLWEDKRGKR